MHSMQESGGGHEAEHSNGYADGPRPPRHEGPALRETLGAVGGMLLPLLTQFGGHTH
jgi:zinc transporter 9